MTEFKIFEILHRDDYYIVAGSLDEALEYYATEVLWYDDLDDFEDGEDITACEFATYYVKELDKDKVITLIDIVEDDEGNEKEIFISKTAIEWMVSCLSDGLEPPFLFATNADLN